MAFCIVALKYCTLSHWTYGNISRASEQFCKAAILDASSDVLGIHTIPIKQ